LEVIDQSDGLTVARIVHSDDLPGVAHAVVGAAAVGALFGMIALIRQRKTVVPRDPEQDEDEGTPSVMRVSATASMVGLPNSPRWKRPAYMATGRRPRAEGLQQLARGIAHDIGNLMTPVAANASWLERDQQLSPEATEAVKEIQAAVDMARDLSRQLMAYAGHGRFDVRTVDLGAVIRETVPLWSTSLQPLRLLTQTDPIPVRVDVVQLRQVLVNLVGNAVKHSRGESIVIRSGVAGHGSVSPDAIGHSHLSAHECAWFEVEDRGQGIDDHTRTHMFEPFFSGRDGGSGIGLAAVMGIVRAHHGCIEVHSELGQGTRIRVWLPISSEWDQ
jgi:signal transduction histidine kinase